MFDYNSKKGVRLGQMEGITPGNPGAFGSLSSDPSNPSSYVGMVPNLSGSIYPQSSATALALYTGTALPYDYKGTNGIYENWGGGLCSFISMQNLAANPFVFTQAAGWTWYLNNTLALSTSTVLAPDGVSYLTNVQQNTTSVPGIVQVNITSTTVPLLHSAWYQWDQSSPPTPNYPAFLIGPAVPLPAIMPSVSTLTKLQQSTAITGGATYTTCGFTPSSGSPNPPTGCYPSSYGGIDIWGYSCYNNQANMPLINGTANSYATLDTKHSALLVDKYGNLDFQITIMPSVFQTAVSTDAITRYLWSGTSTDGLMSCRMVSNGGLSGVYFVLTVRGTDVVNTGTMGSPVRTCQAIETQPITIRCWYNISSGQAGIRQNIAGLYLPDVTASTTGTALAPPATVYIGSNMGSATGAFAGRIKPWVRPAPSTTAPSTPLIEGVWIGDSIVAPANYQGIGSYIYTGGNSGEWVSRSGMGCCAAPSDTISNQLAIWQSLTQWRGLASIKWFCVQVGINDVFASESYSTMVSNYTALIAQLRSDNPSAKIVISEMLPAGQAEGGWTSAQHMVWTQFNTWIDANTVGADAILHDGFVPSVFNNGSDDLAATFDSGDHLHPNPLGRATQAIGGNGATESFRSKLEGLGLLP